MKIAVLMSTYNGGKYLKEQIDSVLNQSIKVDLFVRDDGSIDNTDKILKEYESKNKLKYIKGKNVGAARSFLELLKKVNGYDYYAFSDQDDVWYEDKIERGLNAIIKLKGPALYCSNCELVDSNLHSLGRNTHRGIPTYSLISALCLASSAQGCTSVLNKELANIIQTEEIPEIFILHDTLLTCVCKLVGGTIVYDDKPSMKYRMHENNVVGLVSAKQNLGGVIKDRLNEIFGKKKISFYTQAKYALKTYDNYISEENRKICNLVINSETSLPARLQIIFNKDLKAPTLNKTMTKKLEILFGNG